MSFNEIRLPNLVLVDFYKSALIDVPQPKEEAVTPDIPEQPAFSQSLQYLGNNLRNILILVHYPQEKFLPGEQLDFLTTILKACNLNLADIAIVNTAGLKEDLDHLRKMLSSKVLLLFGAETLNIMPSAALTDFNITDIDGVLTVSSTTLDSFSKNDNEGKLLKRKLWECLKRLFNIQK